MRSIVHLGMTALLSLLVISCGGGKNASTANETASDIVGSEVSAPKSLEDRFADYSKDVVFDKDGRISKDSKRSDFEAKQLTNIGGEYGKKEFAASRYSKKNWSGSRNFDPAKFDKTKNRWQNDEFFVQKQAREAGNAARAQGSTYGTDNYHSTAASEQGSRRLDRPTDVQTDIRRRVSQKPLIIDKGDYEKMSLDEAKGLLGR